MSYRFVARLRRRLIDAFCDRLAISVSEILSATIQLLMRRSNSAKSKSFQAILVRP